MGDKAGEGMSDKAAPGPAEGETGWKTLPGRCLSAAETQAELVYARVTRKMGQNLGLCIVISGGVLFLVMLGILLSVGATQVRCNSLIMPCSLDEIGQCLCSLRGNDGTCWWRMQSAMKCHKVTMQISSGVCQGAYMTGLCGADKKQVYDRLEDIQNAFSALNSNLDGACNVTYASENSRCTLPVPRQDQRPFDHLDCCNPPLQTCMNDVDCCDCGAESASCKGPLKCDVTLNTINGTQAFSRECDQADDACLSYIYPKCRGIKEDCENTEKNIPFSYDGGVIEGDSSCCEQGTCQCRSVCANENVVWAGCPCVQVDSVRTGNGCAKKQCIKSSDFYKEGGIQHKLKAMGAKDVLLCFTDNCNQG